MQKTSAQLETGDTEDDTHKVRTCRAAGAL